MTDYLRRSISSGNGSSQNTPQGNAEAYDQTTADVAASPDRQSNLAMDIQALQILDSSDDCIKVLDLDGRILFMSRGGQVLLGIQDTAPFLNTSWIEFWQGAEQQAAVGAIAKAREGEVCTFQGYRPTPSGKPKWWDIKISPIRGTEGQVERLLCISRDITERRRIEDQRKQAEEKLRESEERYRAIINQAVTGVACTDLDGTLTLVNQKYCDITGYSADELMQLRMQDITHPEDLPRNVELFHRMRTEGIPFEIEKRYIRKDGSIVWVNNSVSVIRDRHGKPQSAVAIVLDISEAKRIEDERKQAEAALRQSEARFRLIVDSAKEYAIFTLDRTGRITSWNSGAERLLGYTETEAIGADGRMLFTPEDNAQGKADQEMQTALSEGRAENERWHLRKDGSRFWGSGLTTPLQSEAGSAQGFVKIMQDKTAERQSHERFRLLYDTTSDLLATEQPLTLMHNLFNKLSVQLELHCYYNFLVEEKDNQPMLHLSNYQGISETVAKAIEWIKFGEHLCGLVAQEQQQIVLGQEQIANHPNAKLAGSLGITAYACQPLIAQGRLLGSLSFGSFTRTHFTPEEIDLLQSTCDQIAIAIDRANLIASIQQQAEQLQQASRIKDEFLAVLSHELRSPLNPILGWAKLLQGGKLDETRTAQALATIERNAKLQSELIEDLLDVSRILQGKLSINISPINLATTIGAAIETVRLAAEAKSVTVEAHLDAEVRQVLGDSTRLQQVVWNLLSNAVKFTPAGGRVEVRLEQMDRQAQITVRDTGKGIGSDFLPYVFDYFRQADSATTRKFGGLGLGLAIVRHLVELHGGTVRAESQGEGLGAAFIVRLPLMPTPSQTNQDDRSPQQSLDLNGIKILVVDDEPDTRELVAFVLEQQGAHVIAVSSANEALLILPQAKPDVLLSDIGMSETDGYMLIQQIRALAPDQGGQIPAIALTAYAGDTNQQHVIAAGFQKHISKPIEPEVLVQAIVGLVRST